LALQTALAEKAKTSAIGVLEAITIEEPKTRAAQSMLDKAGLADRTLVIVDRKDEKLGRAFGNLKAVQVVDVAEVNAWQLMASRKILLTKAAVEALEKRWPKEEQ
jgi:large subunit ribosomal protein L4